MSSNNNQSTELDVIGSRFKIQGFQLGIEETHEQLLQDNFNVGFTRGVPSRFQDGFIRGTATGSLLAQMLLIPQPNSQSTPSRESIPGKPSSSIEDLDDHVSPTKSAIDKARPDLHVRTYSPNIHLITQLSPNLLLQSQNPLHPAPITLHRSIFDLLVLLTIQSKELSAKQPIMTTTSGSTNSTELSPFLIKLRTISTKEDLIDWVNSLPSGRWGTPFAKIAPHYSRSLPEPPLEQSLHPMLNLDPLLTRDFVLALCQAVLDNFEQIQSNVVPHSSSLNPVDNISDIKAIPSSCSSSSEPQAQSSCCKSQSKQQLTASQCCQSKQSSPSSQPCCRSKPQQQTTPAQSKFSSLQLATMIVPQLQHFLQPYFPQLSLSTYSTALSALCASMESPFQEVAMETEFGIFGQSFQAYTAHLSSQLVSPLNTTPLPVYQNGCDDFFGSQPAGHRIVSSDDEELGHDDQGFSFM